MENIKGNTIELLLNPATGSPRPPQKPQEEKQEKKIYPLNYTQAKRKAKARRRTQLKKRQQRQLRRMR